MKRFLPLLLLLPLLTATLPSIAQKKVVVKEFPNGKPEVIIYVKVVDGVEVKVKEEAYYENGNMEYSGEYNKEGAEHGTWKYWYENGKIKAEEKWTNGMENGTFKEYHPDGKLAREIIYKNGKKLKTIEKK
ncbi:MAG: toxin-antitoxin system YwqK family antitoxin [Bacteroidota bacterium]